MTDIPRREVRFNLAAGQAFDESAARQALAAQGFREVSVRKA